MPVGTRGYRSRQLRCCLAAWFAALLAVTPFARPTLPADPVAIAAVSIESLVAHEDDAQANQPSAQRPPAPPSTLGILSRLSLLEIALGLAPAKSPLPRPSAVQQPWVTAQATAFGRDTRTDFEQSSVGTARTPTGPPS